jgi:putative membrane protein
MKFTGAERKRAFMPTTANDVVGKGGESDIRSGITERFDPFSIHRPDPALMRYYILLALLTVPGFPFVLWPLAIRYATLRYHFDEKGVSMSWGWLFQKQIYLTYRRIQDIHVTRNLLQRWLGLASVELQTAAGSSSAEMTIEGILNPEPLRDYLYARMRGASETVACDKKPQSAVVPSTDEALALLREIRDHLRALHERRE